jgi:hypothetical protein
LSVILKVKLVAGLVETSLKVFKSAFKVKVLVVPLVTLTLKLLKVTALVDNDWVVPI